MERLMTIEEAAERLGVNTMMVQELVNQGELVATGVGHRYYFHPEHIEVCLARQRAEAEAASENKGSPNLTEEVAFIHRGEPGAFLNRLHSHAVTEGAIRVWEKAWREAVMLQHVYQGPEHLLVALLGHEAGIPAKVLHQQGLDLFRLRGIVDWRLHPRGRARIADGPQDLPRTTIRLARALDNSVYEAHKLNDHQIDVDHLLLGLLREEESAGEGILSWLGIDLEQARAETLKMMGRMAG